ncbi:MAG TPA: TolC family protein [Gemmatimonadaceae bacterium]|nr:TolC family protein [Gemmatimonadaceae bacterium]
MSTSFIARGARILPLLFAVTPFTVHAQVQPSAVPVVTLAEARSRAAAIAPGTIAARAELGAALWERRSAIASLWTPNLTASTSYTRFSSPFFNFGTGSITPNATNATLQASYTLLGARKFAELSRSRASVASAEAEEVAARFETALTTDRAFYAAVADRELVRVAADRLKRAQEQLAIARVRVTVGEAIASDSLQLLLEVNRARLAALRADSALAVSRLRLGREIGITGPVDAAAPDTTAPPALPMSLEEAVEELRVSGPLLQAARADERRTRAALSVERNAYLPELSIVGTAGAYDARFFPSALHRPQLAFNVSLPIWSGGQREVGIARARALHNISEAQLADQERAVAQVMSESYHGYETARAGVELARSGVAAAAENYRVQRARYAGGAGSILDLLEAQVALSESEVELIRSRQSAKLALAQLEALLGRRILP